MNAKPGGGFETGDAVERAIRDLVGAALYFHRLVVRLMPADIAGQRENLRRART